MAINDEILAGFDDVKLQNIASQLGLQPDQVKGVLNDSLGAILGGINNNVQSPDGAASLANALGAHAGANPLGDIGGLLSGVLGGGILDKVLGANTPEVSQALGNKQGVSGVDVEKILKIAAPLVMAFLAKRMAGGGKADPGAVQKEVQQVNSQAQQGLPDLGSILGGLLGRK